MRVGGRGWRRVGRRWEGRGRVEKGKRGRKERKEGEEGEEDEGGEE